MTPAEAWFIRHAESASNAGLPTAAPGDTPLTAAGQAAAQAYAASFPAAPDRIVASPFLRSRQSAAPLAGRFPAAPLEIWPVQEFTYLGPEHWAGTTAAERMPANEAYWRRGDPRAVDGPGAESFAGLLDRLASALERLAPLPGLSAVFTHGNAMRGLLCLLLLGADAARADLDRSMALMSGLRLGLPIANLAALRVRFTPGGGVRLEGFPLRDSSSRAECSP